MKSLEELKQRVLDISRMKGLSHVGSCISTLPILHYIYETKNTDDIVLLDNGHSSLAWYCVLEAYYGYDAEELLKTHGIHANYDPAHGIMASNGSLGHASGISIGYCIANPDIDIYTIISDGSAMEPELGAALRIAHDLKITNWKIHANFNGFTAVKKIDLDYLEQWIKGYDFPVTFHHTSNGEGLDSVAGHYKILEKERS